MTSKPLLLETTQFLHVLGLRLGASEEDVKKQYRALILKYHPDRAGGSAKTEARNTEMTIKLNEAYNWLQSKPAAWKWASAPTPIFKETWIWTDTVKRYTATPQSVWTDPAPTKHHHGAYTDNRRQPQPMRSNPATPPRAVNWGRYIWWGIIILSILGKIARVATE